MALHHSRRPTIALPPSTAFRGQVRQLPPFSEQPPNKRSRLAEPAPKRVFPSMATTPMATWSDINLRTLLWVNDEVTIDDLKAELDNEEFEWCINEDLKVPLCKDEEDCRTCERYHKHVMLRRGRPDDQEPGSEEAAFQRGEGKAYVDEGKDLEDDDESMDSETEAESRQIEFKSESMRKLFRLRDLQVRRDAFDADDDKRAMGQIEGMMSALTTEKLRAEADRDHANSRWSVVQAQLDTLVQSHRALTESHESMTSSLQTAKIRAEADRDHANASWTGLQAEMDALKQSMLSPKNATLQKRLEMAVASTVWECPNLSIAEWTAMPKPTAHDPPELLACWLQFRGEMVVSGISFHNNFSIDLRDLRGHNEIMARVSSARNPGKHERLRRQRCIMAMLKVLAIPGEYSALVCAGNYPIADSVSHSPLTLQENSTDADVARLLASQGMTTATADDAWQYCYKVVRSMIDPDSISPTGQRDVSALLALIIDRLEHVPEPAGICPPAQDMFSRPSNLPFKRL
ncbi:hypothetical protein B0H19DRAFT_1055687 [Mycena capillaripes]|nr:hypothetical protein B0H19DRAFT_1055687 [Mycena capillaripes]